MVLARSYETVQIYTEKQYFLLFFWTQCTSVNTLALQKIFPLDPNDGSK